MLPTQNPIQSHCSWFKFFTGQRFFNEVYKKIKLVVQGLIFFYKHVIVILLFDHSN